MRVTGFSVSFTEKQVNEYSKYATVKEPAVTTCFVKIFRIEYDVFHFSFPSFGDVLRTDWRGPKRLISEEEKDEWRKL